MNEIENEFLEIIAKNSKLLPCPMCGGEAKIYAGDYNGYHVYEIRCMACNCTNKDCRKEVSDSRAKSISDIINAWNNRPVVRKKLQIYDKQSSK